MKAALPFFFFFLLASPGAEGEKYSEASQESKSSISYNIHTHDLKRLDELLLISKIQNLE